MLNAFIIFFFLQYDATKQPTSKIPILIKMRDNFVLRFVGNGTIGLMFSLYQHCLPHFVFARSKAADEVMHLRNLA